VRPFNTKTGQFGPVADVAPKAAGGAAGGAQAAKARAYADLMEQSMPTIESLSEKVRPTRISIAIAHPTIGNYALNQDEQLYMEAARNFLAGALHLESGARLSKEQWAIGTQRFLPTAGDSPETKAFKLASARQVAADRRKEAGGGAEPDPAARRDGADARAAAARGRRSGLRGVSEGDREGALMGASVRPVPPVPDEAEFERWKAAQAAQAAPIVDRAGDPATHDDAAFQAWKAARSLPALQTAAASTAAAPNQAGRRAAMAAEPPLLGTGALRALEQGATFGFGDELNAGVRVGVHAHDVRRRAPRRARQNRRTANAHTRRRSALSSPAARRRWGSPVRRCARPVPASTR
jgi:hypothetical protein